MKEKLYNLINIWNKYDNIYKNSWRKKLEKTEFNVYDVNWEECGDNLLSYLNQLNVLLDILKSLKEYNGFKGILFFHSLIFPTLEFISNLDKSKYLIVGWCDENLGYIDKSFIAPNGSILSSKKWKYWFELAGLCFYDIIFCENTTIRRILLQKYGIKAYKVYSIGLPYVKYSMPTHKKEDIVVFPYYSDVFLDGYDLFNIVKMRVSEKVPEYYDWVKISPNCKNYFSVLAKAKFGVSFNRRFGNDYGIRDCILNNVIAFTKRKTYRKRSDYNFLLSEIAYKDIDDCIDKLTNAMLHIRSLRGYKGIVSRVKKKIRVCGNKAFKKIFKILRKQIKLKIDLLCISIM